MMEQQAIGKSILHASDGESDDGFGASVSITDHLLCVGAPSDDDNGVNSGSCYAFDISNGLSPKPDLKVDGQDQSLTIPSNQPISVTVSLNPGNYSGLAHDWWFGIVRNSGSLFCWVFPGSWFYCPAWIPVRAYNGPLTDITNYHIYDGTLPAGTYLITFAVDDLNNSFEGTYIDSITVTSY